MRRVVSAAGVVGGGLLGLVLGAIAFGGYFNVKGDTDPNPVPLLLGALLGAIGGPVFVVLVRRVDARPLRIALRLGVVLSALIVGVIGFQTEPGPNYKSSADYQASWSPNGRELAYTRGGTTASNSCTLAIWIRHVAGTGDHRLVADGAEASWSPDGKRVAFVFVDNANTPKRAGIAVVDADGSHRRRLVSIRLSVTPTPCVVGDPYSGELPISAPAWSPDGKLIAYSDNAVCVSRPDGGGRRCFSGICFTRPDGTDRHCFKTGPSWETSWSPDSSRLAFLQGALQGDQSRVPYLRIAVIDRDGRNLRVLRTCCEVDPWYGPVWSRENLIAFGSDGANCLLSPASGSLFALNLGAVVDDLGWSPNGKQIAYSSQADNSLHLLRVRPKHLAPAMALSTSVNGAPRCGTPTVSTTG